MGSPDSTTTKPGSAPPWTWPATASAKGSTDTSGSRSPDRSRGTSVAIPQGQGLIFTTRDRPVRSARGWSAAPVRHGVSSVRSGRRFTLGLVLHDAT